MFSEDLNTLSFDDNGSNSAQEPSPDEEYNDSSDNFSANEQSKSKKTAQHVVFCVHLAPGEVFEQSHEIDHKLPTQQTLN